ncbi:hypothetical protein DYI37_00850 [Fulvimarina endophytica]|uniref:Pyrrolidone-carboxylate peptidase n=1 Tax=Fulvimarina endophytica TaxID=2293836 RepID=A0A371XAI5_9HYPH|nr:hypothetical protein [Fulvimarina endophytica]RFC66054.1 hypothetical protein DYI37_00850 [Fulvimarina endophytica]
MSTILAGFSAFPGAPFNPCADLVESLNNGHASGGLLPVLLPVGWDESWATLKSAIEAERPRNVVMFGLHAKAERVRIELRAANKRELGREDAFGRFPAGPSVTDGPAHLDAKLPWNGIAALLREGELDFEWSCDAGGYLCNDTLYRLCRNAGALGVERYGFVHVPMSDERIGDVVASGEELPVCFNTVPAAKLVRFARGLASYLEAN